MANPSKVLTLDAPIGGWNAFDGLDQMPPDCAVVLENLIPKAGHVDTREGYLEYVDLGTGEPCHTVASLNSASDSALAAASDGGMWDITDASDVQELMAIGGFKNDRWQTRNFRQADEEGILIMCNGEDITQILAKSPTTPPPPTDFFLEDIITSGSVPTWQASWVRAPDDDATVPASAQWNMNLAHTVLRINWSDTLATGHQEQLKLAKYSVVRFVDDADEFAWTECTVTGDYTEGAGYTEYPVTTVDGTTESTVSEIQNATVAPSLPANFIGVEVFKGRCYYWYDNDDSFYYTEAGAYQGELSKFPLGAFVQEGGKLVMITTWTQQDSGDGKDDFIVFMFSTGEILIYQGDDPGGVGFFEMVGRYNTAEPLSIRGKAKYGSDIIISTKDGYIGLSSVIQQGRTSDVPQFSRLIHTAIVDQVAQTSDLYGWDTVLYAKKGLMVFNVPITPDTFQQHVLNTVTQKWCKFTRMNVNCLSVHDERLFGGTNDGRVLAMLESTADNGQPIEFTCLYAFNYLGDPGVQKHVTAAQILTTHSSPEYIQMRGYADFEVPVITPVYLPAEAAQGTWSINPEVPPSALGSFWDEDYWARGGTPFTYKGWQNISAYGYSCSLLVRFAKVNEGVRWRSTNLRYNMAGSQ